MMASAQSQQKYNFFSFQCERGFILDRPLLAHRFLHSMSDVYENATDGSQTRYRTDVGT